MTRWDGGPVTTSSTSGIKADPRRRGAQAFSGDVAGEGAVHWLMLYRTDRTAHFVGLTTTEHGVDGSHSRSIHGSGTGELRGITGDGSLVAKGGPKATYELDYTLED